VPRDLALSADGRRLAFTAVLSTSAILAQGTLDNAAGPLTLTPSLDHFQG
jgi:hypothetical protein